jgi:hypothetical protein
MQASDVPDNTLQGQGTRTLAVAAAGGGEEEGGAGRLRRLRCTASVDVAVVVPPPLSLIPRVVLRQVHDPTNGYPGINDTHHGIYKPRVSRFVVLKGDNLEENIWLFHVVRVCRVHR